MLFLLFLLLLFHLYARLPLHQFKERTVDMKPWVLLIPLQVRGLLLTLIPLLLLLLLLLLWFV